MVRAMKHTHPRLRTLILIALGSAAFAAAAQSPPAGAPPGAAPPPGVAPGPAPAPPAPALSDEEADHLFGITLGETLRALGLAEGVHLEALERGVKDGLGGKKTSPEERRHLQEYMRAAAMAQFERNKQAAQDFLAKKGQEKGVKTTASGLEYKVLKAGDAKAAAPQPNDEVTVNYRGTLIDGTEFDSSYSRGQPASFSLDHVIKGWQEGVTLMKPGAKYALFVPPELGYGANPRPNIPGNSLLIFEIELLSVKPAATPAPAVTTKPGVAIPPTGKTPPGAPAGASAPAEPAARSTTSQP